MGRWRNQRLDASSMKKILEMLDMPRNFEIKGIFGLGGGYIYDICIYVGYQIGVIRGYRGVISPLKGKV